MPRQLVEVEALALYRPYDQFMEIMRLSSSDAAAAADELSEIYASGPIDSEGLRRALHNPDFVLLLARKDEETVGYLHAALLDRVDGARMLMVYDLEVAEADRRTGTGTALMARAREIAKENGARDTWLVTEADNQEAVALYESLNGTRFPAVGYEWSEK